MCTPKVPAVVTVQAEGNAPLNRAWTKMQMDGKNAFEAAQHRHKYMYPWANPKVGDVRGVFVHVCALASVQVHVYVLMYLYV